MPELTAQTITDSVTKFLNDTLDARSLSEKCRDYKDGKQWTEVEAQKVKANNMNPIVVNKIKPKVEGMIGLYDIRRSDPKAFPRTQKHSESGELVTDALRFIMDRNNFDTLRTDVADDFFVEGYGGAIVDITKDKNGENWVDIRRIPWDRIGFDSHSRQHDFSDARYKFVVMWNYREELKEKYPKKAQAIQDMFDAADYTDETFEDKPKFIDKETDRIRSVLHFEIYKSEWYMALMVGNEFIIEPMVSPYLDDEGEPTCPIELVSAYIDRENNRYGEVKDLLGPPG